MPAPPGIPRGRLPLPSSDFGEESERAFRAAHQAEQTALKVEEKLHKQLGAVEGSVMAIDLRLTEIERLLKQGKAIASSFTLKLILAAIGSGGFAGFIARLSQPTPTPIVTEVRRSKYDIGMDVCRAMENGAERGTCVVRVAADDAANSGR